MEHTEVELAGHDERAKKMCCDMKVAWSGDRGRNSAMFQINKKGSAIALLLSYAYYITME